MPSSTDWRAVRVVRSKRRLPMLKGVMSSEAALQLSVMKVWQTMVDSLGMRTAGQYLSQIVYTLLPYVIDDRPAEGSGSGSGRDSMSDDRLLPLATLRLWMRSSSARSHSG